MTTNGNCMGRGDYDYNNYAPPYPESEAVAALSDSEPFVPLSLGPRYAVSPPRPIRPLYR